MCYSRHLVHTAYRFLTYFLTKKTAGLSPLVVTEALLRC